MKITETDVMNADTATTAENVAALAREARKLADTMEGVRVAGASGDPAFDLYAPGAFELLLETARNLQAHIELEEQRLALDLATELAATGGVS